MLHNLHCNLQEFLVSDSFRVQIAKILMQLMAASELKRDNSHWTYCRNIESLATELYKLRNNV